MSDSSVAEFSLPATGGTVLSPAAHRGRPLVIYFYPKDSTPGCTAEAGDFRDLFADFAAAGCPIFGVSRDSLRSHENFKAKLQLPFELASDADETACSIFDVIRMKKLYGKDVRGIERSTFILDGGGRIAREWRGVKVTGHACEVLDTVRAMTAA